MRVLPRVQRRAVFEIYRFCRSVDDVADGDDGRDDRLAELAGWRADIDALFEGVPPSRVRGLLAPIRRFDLPRDDFIAIIDGMVMDAATDIRAPDLAALDIYCDRVACAVGRLCVRVFGLSPPKGEALASSLGRALQLTNILRDLDEDAGKGRLYLPREMLVAAGIDATEPRSVLAHTGLESVCGAVAKVASGHFADADALMACEPRHAVRAPQLMAKVYEQVLYRLLARGWAPPRHPVRLGRSSILWITLRHAVFTAVRR